MEFQFQFNYLFGTSGTEQLYYDFQLWYKIRPDYWGCINPECNSFLSTQGNKLKPPKKGKPQKSLPLHNHDPVSPDEYKIKKHFNVIRERIKSETHTFPSVIFNEEVLNLQIIQKVPISAIGEYIKPYSFYKSGFENMRNRTKPKIPTNFDNFEFKGEY